MTGTPTRRVAVTRSEPPEGPLSRALRRHGLEPAACHVIRHFPAPEADILARAATHLHEYDWVVLASARALAALAAAAGVFRPPAAVRWAAVGAATAAALRERGVEAAVVPDRADATHLLAALRHADEWSGRCVLLPRAQEGDASIASSLRELGARVDEVVAYRTVARPAAAIRRSWNAIRPGGVVVASPTAARALVGALGASAVGGLSAIVAIGPTTAGALKQLGVTATVPPRASFDAAAAHCAELLGVP